MASPAVQKDDPNADTTILVIVVFVAILVIVVLALQAYFARMTEEEMAVKVIEHSPVQLQELRAEQLEQLSGYRWVNADSGTVAIPIERAMELQAAELTRGAGE